MSAALFLSLAVTASAASHYVDINGTNATPPFLDWSTAATNIQHAVNVAVAGDEIVVTNGVYPGGLTVTNPLTLLSVSGPQFTVINGGGTTRCVTLLSGASLTGFTLTNGWNPAGDAGGVWGGGSQDAFLTNCTLTGNAAAAHGGGAFGCTFYHCTLSSNSAFLGGGGAFFSTLYNCTLSNNSAGIPYRTTVSGGGAVWCMLSNCTLSGNSALPGASPSGTEAYGGGATRCTLYNCTLTGNSASVGYGGGAAYQSTLYNCIVYFNTATNGANHDGASTLNYSCTTPDPGGVGNITDAPRFVDSTNGNLRLQFNSPCINAGNNNFVTTATDLDGNPRIVGGIVDIGAYEFQGSGSRISYAWLQYYGQPTDGSADFFDPDGDGMNNWQEWIAGTNPTNALSVLKLLAPTGGVSGVTVCWQSVTNRRYWLERATNSAFLPAFSRTASNLAGRLGTTTYADRTATNGSLFLYRVGVQP